jgi:hypothetical protein
MSLCESETVLREWLRADGVVWDESDLPAALTKLETATVSGFERARPVRGYAASELSHHLETSAIAGNVLDDAPPHGFDDVRASGH